MSRVSLKHHELVPVPIPDRIAAMIGATIPLHVLQAEVDADSAVREALHFRPLNCDEDRQDFEAALSRLARENKLLAKHNPGLIVRAGGVR
jgi:hypothetical protein